MGLKIARVLILVSGPIVCVLGLYMFAIGRELIPPPNANLYAPWSAPALAFFSAIGVLALVVGIGGIILALGKEKNSAPKAESKVVEFRQPRRERRDSNRQAG